MVKKKAEKDEDEGMSLDDAFADDDDVEYAKPKPAKIKKIEKGFDIKQKAEEFDQAKVEGSKPIEKIKKGDKIKIDSVTLEVDAHIVLIDHGTTREMAIECFDPKTDKDYQIRYFSDQVDTSLEVYALEEIVYNKINVKKIEW